MIFYRKNFYVDKCVFSSGILKLEDEGEVKGWMSENVLQTSLNVKGGCRKFWSDLNKTLLCRADSQMMIHCMIITAYCSWLQTCSRSDLSLAHLFTVINHLNWKIIKKWKCRLHFYFVKTLNKFTNLNGIKTSI